MTYTGVIIEGKVVLENAPALPEGTRVEVVVKQLPKAASPLGEALLKHAGKAVDLPEDMAEQHDHYIHGTPKR